MADLLLDKKEDGGQPLYGDSAIAARNWKSVIRERTLVARSLSRVTDTKP